jgi:hypothetical protein
MVKVFFLLLCLSTLLLSNQVSQNNIGALSESDVVLIENGMLKSALKDKDIAKISSYALSFFLTANSALYKGDRVLLRKKAMKLFLVCIKENNVTDVLFLMTKYLKTRPTFVRKIGRLAIDQYSYVDLLRYNNEYFSIVMLFASSVLNEKNVSTKELNYTIDAIMSLPKENDKTNFFLAFLFARLNSLNIANNYLNNACHLTKKGSKIYNFCINSKDVVVDDNIENKVIIKDCNADAGRRCK